MCFVEYTGAVALGRADARGVWCFEKFSLFRGLFRKVEVECPRIRVVAELGLELGFDPG